MDSPPTSAEPGPRSRLGRAARFLGLTRPSTDPPPPAGLYWAVAGVALVVGIVSIFMGGRVAVVGWLLLFVGAPLMAFLARRPRA